MNDIFRKLSAKMSIASGSPWAFIIATVVVIVWAISGPAFNFSATWQLVINTGTTIVTFLMVFLIQNTQNRDSKAVHIKLDELLKSGKGARTSLVNIEDLPDEILESLSGEFKQIQAKYSAKAKEANKPKKRQAHQEVARLIENIISVIQKPLNEDR